MDKLTRSDIKILETVSSLNDNGFYPLPDGVYKILKGVVDKETVPFMDYPTFSTLISCKSKRISMSIMLLVRYKYFEKIYSEKHDELFLKISDFGKSFLLQHHKKHKGRYKKKEKQIKTTIVHI